MLQVGGKPILQHIIERLTASGFSTFYISVNYLAEQIEGYFGDGSDRGISIAYLHEDSPLDTGGPISLLPEEVGQSAVLVVNGDILSQVDFVGLVEFHAESEADATMCIRPHFLEVPFGVVDFEDGAVRALIEKPTYSVHVNAGIYVVGPRLRARLQKTEAIGMPDLMSRGIEAGDRVMVFPVHEEWADIGRHEDLSAVRKKHDP
jgi:NDP-sugar pyrophosphorylase family protein